MTITEIGIWNADLNAVFTFAASCVAGCGCGFDVVGTYRDDYCLNCT